MTGGRLNYTLAQLLLVVVMVANVCGALVAVRELLHDEPPGWVCEIRFFPDGKTFAAVLVNGRVVTCDTATCTIKDSVWVYGPDRDWSRGFNAPYQSPIKLAGDCNTWVFTRPDGRVEFGRLQPPKRWYAEVPQPALLGMPASGLAPAAAGRGKPPDRIALSENAAVLAALYKRLPGGDRVVLWDVPSGKVLHVVQGYDDPIQFPGDVRSICLTPDGKTLAIETVHAGFRRPTWMHEELRLPAWTIDAWDVETGRQRRRAAADPYGGCAYQLQAPNNDLLVWLSEGGHPSVISLRVSDRRRREFHPADYFYYLSLSDDGRTVLLDGGAPWRFQLLDAESLVPWGPAHPIDYRRYNSQGVGCLALSPSGKELLVAQKSGTGRAVMQIADVNGKFQRLMLLHTTSPEKDIVAVLANGLVFLLCLFFVVRQSLRRRAVRV